MIKDQCGFSLMQEPLNRIEEGYRWMLSLVKLITPDKKLVKDDGEWDRKKSLEYLNKKKRFLELLMAAMHLTGGQPARGPELGSIKFRNSAFSLRNFFIMRGNRFYVTEYHKARASTQYSYFIARYLPRRVSELFAHLHRLHPSLLQSTVQSNFISQEFLGW